MTGLVVKSYKLKSWVNRSGRKGQGAPLASFNRRRCTYLLLACAAAMASPKCSPALVRPTVYPVLRPSAAIDLPITLGAPHVSTWTSRNGTIHLVAAGGAVIHVGYRVLMAQQAAIWLRPSSATGLPTFHARLFLLGKVTVRDGLHDQTVLHAPELLVTTHTQNTVELTQGPPQSVVDTTAVVYQRGEAVIARAEAAPLAAAFTPRIHIQNLETALRLGWFAEGAHNVLIPEPVLSTARQNVAKASKPVQPPMVFATGQNLTVEQIGPQRVTVARGQFYMVLQHGNGQPPLELRADNAVVFSPAGHSPSKKLVGHPTSINQNVQGIYLDGDVTITYGDESIHARRVYYDFTTNRAIMLDAVMSTYEVQNHSPLYMRAKKLLQLAQGDFEAKSVKLSTDEFYVPHYYIGASSMAIQSLAAPVHRQTHVYAFQAKNVVANFMGVPFFYWPYLSGTTRQNPTPLRRISAGYSSIYGATVRTDWDLFGLLNQPSPPGLKTDLAINEYSSRGPGTGINSYYSKGDARGILNSFIMYDDGTDQLGANRDNIPLPSHVRGFISGRYQQPLNHQWSIAVQGSYISDPNFLEQYFQNVYATAPEQQTSVYLKQQHGNEAFTVLGKFQLNRFVANADLENNEYSVQKYPEVKYWRNGDKVLGLFTFYTESSGALLNDKFSSTTAADRALQLNFPGINPNETFADYYLNNGWTNQNVARLDTREELDLPLALGPVQFDPYVVGRVTYWDTSFPASGNQLNGNTTRLWGQVGFRSSVEIWKTYHHIRSNFFDVHQLRHIIEPEISLFQTGSTVQRGYLQPFSRDVEGITDASGAQFALRQVFQTLRGRPGHRQEVNWITLNVDADVFWNQPKYGPFYPGDPMYAGAPFSTSDFGSPVLGYFDFSRPDLSQVADSLNSNFSWRIGADVRALADEDWSIDNQKLEKFDTGLAVDQSPNLSYFFGNQYLGPLSTDQWTVAVNYQLTRKYIVSLVQSYDFSLAHNVMSSITLVRKLPRFYTAVTLGYSADTKDTAVFFSIFPAGYPHAGIVNSSTLEALQQ